MIRLIFIIIMQIIGFSTEMEAEGHQEALSAELRAEQVVLMVHAERQISLRPELEEVCVEVKNEKE